VYLKLVRGIDICEKMTPLDTSSDILTNNNEICNLINPIPITAGIENVDYSGEIMTGITILPDGQLEDKTVLVKTMVKNIATKFVKDVITESLNKVAPSQAVCTTIELCTVIIGKTGSICGRAKESCRYHNKAKTQKVTPLIDDIESQPVNKLTKVKPTPKKAFVTQKLVPMGGKRKRKSKRNKKIKKRTIKKR
jgi:hypothetical protein